MPILPTIEEEGKLSWLRQMWHYRLQFQSLTAGKVTPGKAAIGDWRSAIGNRRLDFIL